MNEYYSPETRSVYRGTRVVWYLFGLLEILLAFRFILRLTGANSAAAFTSFIYALSYPFVAPFVAVFRITQVEGAVFEWTTLLAMAVYWIIAAAIVRLFFISRPISTVHAAEKLDREEELDEDR